ncbi:MAG: long-chain fatty acid--CoA ligase, partial [Clostridia bacterium]|nr:long-chain fatty acid--CoA ligase [Clostridia bacterium]
MPATSYASRPWLAHYPPHVDRDLTVPAVTLDRILADTARAKPAKAALRLGPSSLTFEELHGAVQSFAAGLRTLGLTPGERVAVMLPNLPQYVISYYGTLLARAVVAQVNPLYVERELSHLLSDSGAQTLVLLDAFVPRALAVASETPLRRLVVVPTPGAPQEASPAGSESAGPSAGGLERLTFDELLTRGRGALAEGRVELGGASPDDVAVLQYTGGTTGTSKGAMLTHRNLVANVHQLATWVENFYDEGETMLAALPLFHSYGMTVCMNYAIFRGSTSILVPRFEPAQVLELIRAFRPTSFPGVPTMYIALNALPDVRPEDLASLRVCNSGGAAMPVEVMRQFEARTGATIIEGYGLSETSPVTHCNPTVGLRKPGSIGIPVPLTEARVVDVETGEREVPVGEVGEICVRGPQVMKGYWNQPEETEKALRDGWLYTGDIGRMDEDGYFYVTDRKKDMINAGGFNVYPRDVEEVLFQHPAVQEAAVVGVPDPYRGETVKAYVVPKAGASVSEAELDAHCRRLLAAYKVPRIYEFRAELPKSMVGKVLRRVLLEEEKAR